MIDRKNVRTTLGMFDIIKQYFTDEAFLVSVYISIKYDKNIFEEKIDDTKMEKIYEELQKQKAIFNKDLTDRIEKIIKEE